MKKITLILIAFCASFSAFSQNPMREKVEEKVKTQRIAFITQRLSLTETEAQQFWPIFNEFTEKVQQIRKQPKPEKPADELDNADVEKNIMAQFDRDAKELELKKEYFQKLKKVISVKKIAKLYRAEKDFRTELVRQLQEMRGMKKKDKKWNRE
jgi:predicted TIM-barrel fold metal-dependent hydrolase